MAIDDRLELIEVVHGVELREGAIGALAQPVDFSRRPHGQPHGSRRPAVAALRQSGGSKGAEPPWGVGEFAGSIERLGRLVIVVVPPVVDEPDILHVLPLIGSSLQTLFEQADGQIRPPWTGRRVLGQEDGAEPVGQVEVRIQ